MIIGLSGLVLVSSCKKEDENPMGGDAVASFDLGTVNGLEVSFVNASVNATGYEWDFGDGNSSADAEPTHTYEAAGTYTVTLTASNADGSDVATKEVTVMEADVIRNFIVGKNWQLIREESVAFLLGPNDDTWSWNGGLAPWFSLGDMEGATPLAIRSALVNDVYTFNEDGTYNVDFMGDFFGEFGIWGGTAFNEVDIDISGGMLPLNANGNDVSAFIAGTWDYSIDEVNQTISVIGAGAHIINPRYKNDESSYEAGEGITYQIWHTAEGPDADTLVLRIDTHDNDFDSYPTTYIVLADYRGNVPDINDANVFVPVDHADEVSASTISHQFDAEGNFGSGVDEVQTTYTATYGVEVAGETCTQLDRIEANGNDFQDFKLVSTDADIRFDTDGTYDFSKASIQVYMPSSNTYGDLTNQVEIILADESGDDDGAEGGPGFWCCWTILSQENIDLDTWTTLEFDFTGVIDDMDAQWGIRDDIDMIIIRLGGSGHPAGGTFYVKDFKFIE